MKPSPSRAAFGVVELLIVAVGAVLALLLLPAISGMRERSQTAACAANLHQIGVAMLLYANEHQGQYAFHRWSCPGFHSS